VKRDGKLTVLDGIPSCVGHLARIFSLLLGVSGDYEHDDQRHDRGSHYGYPGIGGSLHRPTQNQAFRKKHLKKKKQLMEKG
jgi:hypothetical protein